jgi:GTP cyclohydrolase I
MKDVQNQHDARRIEIQKVGVKNVYADLPHDFKGTHMSRFIDVVNEYYVDISMHNFMEMLGKIRSVLDASRAYAEVFFPYFIEKQAPVSGERSMMEYNCEYIGEVGNGKEHFYVGIQVPITTVCLAGDQRPGCS